MSPHTRRGILFGEGLSGGYRAFILIGFAVFSACRTAPPASTGQLPIHLPVGPQKLLFGMPMESVQGDPNFRPKKAHPRITIVPLKFDRDGELVFPAQAIFLDNLLFGVAITPMYLKSNPVSRADFERLQGAFRQKCESLYGTPRETSMSRRPDTGEQWTNHFWKHDDFSVELKLPPSKDTMGRAEMLGGLNLYLTERHLTKRDSAVQRILRGVLGAQQQ